MDASSTWRVLFDAIGYSSEPRASSRSLDLAPCPISDIIYHLVAVFSFPVSLVLVSDVLLSNHERVIPSSVTHSLA